jgi:hypothetical protein
LIYEQTALPGFAKIRVDEKNSKGSTAERLNDYDGFTQKFEAKKTTDDCYTPPLVYDAIAGWVCREYGVNRDDFIRPFYPGNDYTAFDYTGKIVVDNPPFSILAQIIDFYNFIGVKFFLFAPLLTSMKHSMKDCCFICCDCTITYENGANVNTAFLTNLEPYEIMIRTAPDLKAAVSEANAKAKKERKPPDKPKYKYPPEVVSIQLISAFARHDIDIKIRRDELCPIGTLDSQRAHGKAIFGGGFLTSHTRGAELDEARRQADEARRQVWELSPRELDIIDELERRRNE